MKNLLKGLAVIFAMSFVMVGCGDEDPVAAPCTTCELNGTSYEVCPDNLDAGLETFGATAGDIITALETQGYSCN